MKILKEFWSWLSICLISFLVLSLFLSFIRSFESGGKHCDVLFIDKTFVINTRLFCKAD